MAKSTKMAEATFAVNVRGFHFGLLRLCPKAIGYSFNIPVILALLLKDAVFATAKMVFQVPMRLRYLFPAYGQHLAVETRKQAHQYASPYASPNASTDSLPSLISPGFSTYRKQAHLYASPNASTDSLPSLISPGSSTYSSNIGDLDLDLDLDPDDDELPSLPYVPPTPEEIKRWVELSFEERRKVADMQYNGWSWMSWSPPPSPSLPSRQHLPNGIPEWREEWSDFDLPPNPPNIPKSKDLGRWWGEATEEDRARINRINIDGLNWRTWGAPPPQRPCDGEFVVWSGIGPWAETGDDGGLPNGSPATGSSEQTLNEPMLDQQPLVQRHPHKGSSA
ncbi:hypothetical protein B0H65DRAFT_161180 [Neurospora tetraspora]|uniref:Peroxin domain-containing protein n=1 Tax=Neurospora tetraspora TaxID=94610 RepID=A0AAE0JHJ7_9PEZI|nr:hypothetical protein B0H65DRAFT_161180 [Neurospora tetraspora]